MSRDTPFGELIRRVRAGDPWASSELVRRYEPAIRLAVHVRLTDPGLRRLLDSGDICQSVLVSFFRRAALGHYEIDSAEQLLKLLTTMARNKLISCGQKLRAARRDYRRVVHTGGEGREFVDPGPDPGQVVADREFVAALQNRMSAEERRLADGRASGRSWKEIAAEVGGNPNALRMRLMRALGRVTQELGVGA